MTVRTRGKELAFLVCLCLLAPAASGQVVGSATRNVETAGRLSSSQTGVPNDLSIAVLDQSTDRPFAYLGGGSGWSIIDISDPAHPTALQEVETDQRVTDMAHFQAGERTFLAVAAGDEVTVFDVSEPASETIQTVGKAPGGETTTLFPYRHSDGRTLLVVASGGDAVLYDASDLTEGRPLVVASIQTPHQPTTAPGGFERAYAAFHADTDSDRFYGAGAGGYHVFDITNTDSVTYLTSATPAAVRRGHMVSATPDGRYLLAGAEYRAAPLRIFDLQPAFDGTLPVIRTSVGAWTENWTSFLVAHELRWPLVFVAAGEQGLQVFNMRDADGPYTYAFLRTSASSEGSIDDRVEDVGGAVDVDVRNSDGLVAVADRQTGLWLIRIEAFSGWDGRGYGIPNVSSVQNWTDGPNGVTSF